MIFILLEIKILEVFKVTGRGYVLAGEIIKNDSFLKVGDILLNKDNPEQSITVNSIYILSNVSEELALSLIGKHLYKE